MPPTPSWPSLELGLQIKMVTTIQILQCQFGLHPGTTTCSAPKPHFMSAKGTEGVRDGGMLGVTKKITWVF